MNIGMNKVRNAMIITQIWGLGKGDATAVLGPPV